MSDPEKKKLAELMRSDWNRRVSHDYRFWMSDGYRSDQQMWESGERDLALVTEGLADTGSKVFLELGCGVGRLLKAASSRFQRVIGLDISDVAIAKAESLLGSSSKIELLVGNGLDLAGVATESVDVALSFAAITSAPTEVIAGYLRELHRVLQGSGVVRLQMYLGEPQNVSRSNTLHLRCFERANFERAVALAGFSVDFIRELVLPFQVSAKEWGIEAVLVSLTKNAAVVPASAQEISQTLNPNGEVEEERDTADGAITTADLEYWMSLHYAQELLERGEIERARASLEFALTQISGTTIDAQALVDELTKRINATETVTMQPRQPSHGEFYQRNMLVLQQRFPAVAKALEEYQPASTPIEVRQTVEGPVVAFDGQVLDHATKPRGSAEQWATRSIQELREKPYESIVVYGFACGYHLESLLERSEKAVSCVEPEIAVLRAAVNHRDLTGALTKLTGLSVGNSIALPFVNEHSELLVRPQTQVIAGKFCAELRALFYGKRGLSALQPNIAVLGPLQGGTLPIAAYVARALGEIGQRVRPWDVSGFAKGFHIAEDFLNDKARRTIVQNQYVSMISSMLLEAATEKPIDILICMAQAPISGAALAEFRKRGVITVLWFVEDYQRFGYWREMAKFYDFVFTIQKGGCIEAIKAAGAGEVHYLPTACDPMVHTPLQLPPEERERWGSPVSFVGAGYHNRQQVFAGLADHPFKIWGTEWPTCRPFDKMVQEQGRRLDPAEYIKIFNSTEINLNLHSSAERDGVDPFGDFINPRVFELAATGAFQLCDERQLLPEAFAPGKEIITFKTPREMREKIAYYRAHPEERAPVVAAARERALREHTYAHRMRDMLSTIYASRFEQLRRRIEQSPWSKLLKRAEKHEELSARCKVAHLRGEEPTMDGLISDIVTGKGKLTETEQKLLFLFHIRKQIIRMKAEESGESGPR